MKLLNHIAKINILDFQHTVIKQTANNINIILNNIGSLSQPQASFEPDGEP